MAYVPNATTVTEPIESRSVESAALEFRTLKEKVVDNSTAILTSLRDATSPVGVLPSVALRAGKALVFDGAGNPAAAAIGDAADPGLRSDLAASTGASLVGYSGSSVKNALDSTVRLSGAQSVAGVKTFNDGIALGVDLSISDGGTGASTAAAAFDNLKQDATTSASGVVTLTADLDSEHEFSDNVVTGGALVKKKLNILPYVQLSTSFSATFSGTTMTVTSMAAGEIVPGMLIAGAGITAGTKILALGTGTGGTGTYTVSVAHTIASPITVKLSGVDFAVSTNAKRITLTMHSGSTNSTSNLLLQLGKNNTMASSGYSSVCATSTGGTIANSSAGFLLTAATAATDSIASVATLHRHISKDESGDSLYFTAVINTRIGTSGVHHGCGEIGAYLPFVYTALTLRLTTVTGTSLFDAGTVSCTVE